MTLEDKKIVVVGLARSGMAAVELLAARGARVHATDMKGEAELDPSISSLSATLALGGHPEELLEGATLVVVSPGVPANSEFLTKASERGIEIIGELELAWRLLPASTRVIAVTGSNGKSTTVTLTGHLLEAAGIECWVGGNLGTPLSRLVLSGTAPAWAVVEVSSFQLEWAPAFAPEVAAVLNVSANHLDRHASMEEYAGLKGGIYSSQDAEAYALYNRDDEWSRRLSQGAPAQRISFGGSESTDGALYNKETVKITLDGRTAEYSLASFPAPGLHNAANAAAALTMAVLAGADRARLGDALSTFQPLPHRLERVAVHEGVTYYNDSKATTVTALARSLACFDGQVVLISGGRDKGGDFAAIAEDVGRRTKAVILIGEATDTIASAWEGRTNLLKVATLDDAFHSAKSTASRGDTVLFSPACASFDMFENFEVRGDAFRSLAQTLTSEDAQ